MKILENNSYQNHLFEPHKARLEIFRTKLGLDKNFDLFRQTGLKGQVKFYLFEKDKTVTLKRCTMYCVFVV